MSGGVLDRGFDESAGSALAERAASEVVGQLEIEMIGAVAVRLAGGGGCLEDGDVHARRLDGDLGMVDRLAEEVVGAHRAGDVVAGPVVASAACRPSP